MWVNSFTAIRPQGVWVAGHVGANQAGEFIRRYAPTGCRGGGARKGESCRRIHSPLFALKQRHRQVAPGLRHQGMIVAERRKQRQQRFAGSIISPVALSADEG
jgi:hypothetical protein